MDIFAPLYYRKFKCIAEKCDHSCCIGWEIQVDESTISKIKKLDTPLSLEILSHIEKENNCYFIESLDNGRCPFLTGCGLCKIISELGEEYTSEICREHPRFYNILSNRIEAGLGIACREAARIILTDDEFYSFTRIGEWESKPSDFSYDATADRNYILDILSKKDLSYRKKTETLESYYNVSPSLKSEDEWNDIIQSLEFLSESNKKLLTDINFSKTDFFEQHLTRFLAYMVYRHLSVSESLRELRARFGFCLFCAQLLESLIASDANPTEGKLVIYASLISEEIEYSEENTENLIFEFDCLI